MKTFILSVFVVGCLITSCKKDNPVSEPPHINLLKRSVLQAGTNDSIVRTYTYDANNRVIGINQTPNPSNASRSYIFSYDINGRLAYYDDNILGRNRLTFDAAGKVLNKKSYTVSGTTETLRDTYIYTYTGSVVTLNYTPKTGNGFIEKYDFDSNGNLITLTDFAKSSPTDNVGTADGLIAYGSYDAKINIAGGFPALVIFPSNSVNNPGTVKYGASPASNYNYIYNVDGYVTKRTESYNSFNSVDTYEYTRL